VACEVACRRLGSQRGCCVWKSAWRDTVASGKVRGAQSVGSATVRGVQGVASREPPWRAPQCLASRAGVLKAPWRPAMCVVLIRCPGRGGRHGRRHGGRRALLQSHATWRNNASVIHSSSRTPGRHAPWRAQHSGGHARFWTPRTVRGWQVSRDLNDSEPRASCAQGREPARRRRLATALAHDMITFITPKNKTMCLTQNNSGMQNNSRMQGFRTSLPPSLFCASRLNGGRTQRRHTQAATEAPQAATEAPQAATQVRP